MSLTRSWQVSKEFEWLRPFEDSLPEFFDIERCGPFLNVFEIQQLCLQFVDSKNVVKLLFTSARLLTPRQFHQDRVFGCTDLDDLIANINTLPASEEGSIKRRISKHPEVDLLSARNLL
jgi:hypothetical protein